MNRIWVLPSRSLPLALAAFVFAACHGEPSRTQLEDMRRKVEANPAPARPREIAAEQALHTGPAVSQGLSGTARFASDVRHAFDPARAMATATFADGFYREPGNDGFEAVLARLQEELVAAGFGTVDGFTIETIETPLDTPAWTPLSARLALRGAGGERVLLEFHDAAGASRTMLPHNAPSAKVDGPLAFALDDVQVGSVLALERPASRSDLQHAKERGAVLVLSAGLQDYNVDPTGAERHLDAIQYSGVSYPCAVPTARISARVLADLKQAHTADPEVRVAFQSEVRFDARPLHTLVATVRGATRPDEAVVVAGHVQEPGACDNASGLAAVCEDARVIAGLIRAGTLARPARSLVFVWGLEHRESRVFLEHTAMTVVAGISADMLGESTSKTGAIALLERAPDPGAVRALAPDVHTAWGSTEVTAGELDPNGLVVVARCAMLDVGTLDGTWRTSEHPYEGGSDHDEFLRKGIPGVLFWHFPDFAYHTSLDRMALVDPDELARTGCAVLVCALAIADAQPTDLDRYLESLRLELEFRVAAAVGAKDDELVGLWREWGGGARQWLRRLCLPAVAQTAQVPALHSEGSSGTPATPTNTEPSAAPK